MATLSENTVFESLFQSALEDYEKQTGINLAGHPLAVQLDGCDTVDSINEVLQEQARSFREFRGSDNKIMKSLRRAVQVLHKLSGTAVFGEAIGLVRRIGQFLCISFCLMTLPQPGSLVKSIHTGIGTLLAVSFSLFLQANLCDIQVYRRLKTSARATTHSLTSLSPSGVFSNALIFTLRSLLRQP